MWNNSLFTPPRILREPQDPSPFDWAQGSAFEGLRILRLSKDRGGFEMK
jgi:hypothetical protein